MAHPKKGHSRRSLSWGDFSERASVLEALFEMRCSVTWDRHVNMCIFTLINGSVVSALIQAPDHKLYIADMQSRVQAALLLGSFALRQRVGPPGTPHPKEPTSIVEWDPWHYPLHMPGEHLN